MKINLRKSADKFFVGLLLLDLLVKGLFLNFGRTVFNSGISFGVGEGVLDGVLVRVVAIGGMLILLFWWTKLAEDGVGERLIIIGGVSNLIDRLLYGKVVDYLHFSQLNLWLNLGDIYITVGVLIVVISELRRIIQ